MGPFPIVIIILALSLFILMFADTHFFDNKMIYSIWKVTYHQAFVVQRLG